MKSPSFFVGLKEEAVLIRVADKSCSRAFFHQQPVIVNRWVYQLFDLVYRTQCMRKFMH